MDTKCVTFFSYKGGSGRTSTALNTLPYFAKALYADKDSPILLLDMDLDSAGMTYLLDMADDFQKDGAYDVKDFLTGTPFSLDRAASIREQSFGKKLLPVGKKLGLEDDEAVRFLGVNDTKVIDNSDLGEVDSVFNRLDIFCRDNAVRAVVLDSSTGTQPSAWASVEAANLVVMCLRATRQFRIGTFNYLNLLKKKSLNKKILLLPTVVPEVDMEIESKNQRETAVDDILGRIKNDELKNINTNFVAMGTLGINEVERFKWLEGVLYKIGQEQMNSFRDDEKKAAERYKRLAQTIATE